MPVIKCPKAECTYKTPDVEPVVAAALLNVHATDHVGGGGNTAGGGTASRPPPMERPKLQVNCPRSEWEIFAAKWRSFKVATSVSGDKVVHQLLGCMDSDLASLVYNEHASPESLDEVELLDLIKKVAVKPENIWVTRERLHAMKQDSGEPVTSFAARLKGQARLCGFQVKAKCAKDQCNQVNVFDFTDTVVMGDLVRGLGDPEIKSIVLGEVEQKTELNGLIELIQAKEYGRSSSSQSAVNSVTSGTPRRKCPNCGRIHEKGATWREHCPAKAQKCNECGKVGHFAAVCRSKDKGKKANAVESEDQGDSGTNAIENEFGYLFAFDVMEKKVAKKARQRLNRRSEISEIKALPHLVWDDEEWKLKSDQQVPMVNIKYKLCWDGYAKAGFKAPTQKVRPKQRGPLVGTVSAMADTGCSTMVAGIEFIKNIGLTTEDLVPVRTVVKAANKTRIEIIGAVIVEIRLNSPGMDRLAKQIVYISPMAARPYLNLGACKQLGLVPESFPKQTIDGAEVHSIDNEGMQLNEMSVEIDKTCECPVRAPPPPMPEKLPFPAHETDKLKQWLIERYSASAFNVCEHQPLPQMKGEPLRIFVRSDVKPHVVHTPAPIPVHFRTEVKKQLDRDVRLEVLEKVPPNTPTTWCSRLVIATKANGSPRRTVDLQALNNASVRQTHHTRSPYNMVREIPANMKKTVYDAWNGYHSVPLHPEDRHYTTFITDYGRYRYRNSPQGYIASGDGYTHRYYEIVEDLTSKVQCVDDTCQWSPSVEQCFFQTCEYLQRCAENGIILNPSKFQFAQEVVDFVGFEIGPDYVKPSKKFQSAITELPRPKTLSDVRSFFGLVEQISYTFYSSEIMAPFRELLRPKNADKGKIYWDEKLEEIFVAAKTEMLRAMEAGVQIFDPTKPTAVETDWSKNGIGHTLSQKHCSCASRDPGCCTQGWKVVAFASRFCHPAESNYSPVEGEALSAAAGLQKFKHFVLGCSDLILLVDHKPLVKLLGDKRMEDIPNMRLLRLKEKTLPFKFRVVHRPGKLHTTPDFGSRYPNAPADLFLDEELNHVEEIEVVMHDQLMETWDEADMLTITWQMVKQATMADPTLGKLKKYLEEGVDDARIMPAELRQYSRHFDQMWIQDEVILVGNRTVIPHRLQGRVLDHLHAAHQGVSQMAARAEIAVFWPGIHADLERIRNECKQCRQNAPSNPKLPPHSQPTLDFPFQQICADYMAINGVPYLVTVDRLTGWPDVRRATSSDSGGAGLVKMLRGLFVTFGISEELASDGGAEFMSNEVQKFLHKYGVRHRVSSVGNPHSNQRAEVGIKSMKRMLKGNLNMTGSLDDDSFAKAILQYRNTPLQSTGLSPAVALFGHPIRDFLPLTRKTYVPAIQWIRKMADRENKMKKCSSRENKKWSHGARKQDPLRVGHEVSIQNLAGNHPLKWDRTGLVVEALGNDQYNVRVDGTGRITLRNRKHLKPIGFQQPADPFPRQVVMPSTPVGKEGCTGNKNMNSPALTRCEPRRTEPTIPGTPANYQEDRSLPVRMSDSTSTPVSVSRRDDPVRDEYTRRSELFTTPLRSPHSTVSPEEPGSAPMISPTRAMTSPGISIQEKQVRIHPELRPHNKPGTKETLVDPVAPRATRSGKHYWIEADASLS